MVERDGTSQAGRGQPALDPGYAAIDERSAQDLLELAQAYAGELRYFNERDEPDGDWAGLLGRGPEALAGLAALVERSAPAGARADRPHVALLLAFLRLLGYPRELVNSLTGRHLAFYYERLLRLSRKAAVADRVHVLFRLAAGAERARLPAGTLLRAGKDGAGRDRIYQTDRELVVGRAKVARLSSVYVQRDVVGLREARERHKGTREEAALRMLAIALGAPRPGDPLPRYGGKDVTYPLLLELAQRVGFAAASLYMGFSDLHFLMKLVRQRAADAGEWRAINAILERAGRKRLNDPQWSLSPADPRDFAANLAKAIGGPLDFARDGLAGVNSIEDLYEQRIRQDVKVFIRDRLYLSEADFIAMMQVKIRVDSEWREINRILEQAGRRKRNNPAYRLDPRRPPTAFDANLQAAIGPIPFGALPAAILPPIADLGSYYSAILAAESYFHLNAAQIGYVLTTAEKRAPVATDREWASVYRLLSEAHRDKVYAERRAALAAAVAGAASPIAGFRAVLRIALGTAAGEPDPALPALRPYVAAPEDYAFLELILARLERGAISSDDWARVFLVVELAQRVRERLPEPAAQRETWLDLFPAADATQIAADTEATPPRWRTFGQRPPEADLDRPPPPAIGWAIRSPMLLLAQGKRTIVLTLGFLARGFDAAALGPLFAASLSGVAPSPLELQVSTEKGWRPVDARPAMGDYRALSKVSRAIPEPLRAIQLTLALGEDAPAVAPGPPGAAGLPGGAPWPALRILLRRVWSAERGQHVSRYEAFRDLVLAAVHLQVKVDGLVPSAIQSEDAVLSAKKPFEPFGATPGVGARFFVGDPELVQKRLDGLTFHVEWRGGPADLAAHYANYPDPGPFTAQINLIDDRLSLPITAAPVPLFTGNDATKRRDIELTGIPAALEKQGTGYRYEPAAEVPPAGPVAGWRRYLEWELRPIDFKHHVYPALAAEKAVALTAALIEKPPGFSAASYQVRPPYTPKIQRLWVDYAAQLELELPAAPGAGLGAGLHELFHVHPFGASPIGAEAAPGGARFLPEYEHEGELYIGVQGARPPETLSLLVQVAEGSADPDLRPAPIEWSYLSGDRWRTLHDGHLLLDTTRGLIDSGIVQLALPPAEPSARLPGELYWIRAAIAERPDSVCDAVAIHAQAVSATLAERGNAPDHYARGLPARSVAGLVQRVAQIAAVEQPYPSRGGRAPESDGAFFTRASERLRHKQRALTPWDYERLVLERFPELYKVKCIPADAARDPAPGAVRIVVIPDLRGRGVSDRFEPKASAALIAEIDAHLAEVRPPEARLTVQSARFVQVKVRVGVRFRGAGDEVFYQSLLQADLQRFLSPWAYDGRADLVIGGTVTANGVVSFVDGLDYIDYVAAIELFTSEDGQVFRPVLAPADGSYQVTADGPDGVLVTARRHEIDVVPDAGYMASSFTGINYMKIELDFVVAGSAASTPSP